MKSKLFEQVLKECNFANLPSKYDESMKEASKSIDFHFDKVGKDCFKISVKKEKYQEILKRFPEAEVRDLVEGEEFNLFKLKFKDATVIKSE
jgi:hypothetical protein